jgi:hypothetical protein
MLQRSRHNGRYVMQQMLRLQALFLKDGVFAVILNASRL